jgi:hypothetical protein
MIKTQRTTYRSIVGVFVATALLLLVPLVAMQVSDQVTWSLGDFVVAAALLVGAGLTYVLVASKAQSVAYRAAVGVAVFATLFLVWVSLAVGILGVEGDPADLMYLGVIAVGIIGAILARFEPAGMARAMFAAATAQVVVAAIALIIGKQNSPASSLREVVGVNAMFTVLFLVSASLFRHSAQSQTPAK